MGKYTSRPHEQTEPLCAACGAKADGRVDPGAKDHRMKPFYKEADPMVDP